MSGHPVSLESCYHNRDAGNTPPTTCGVLEDAILLSRYVLEYMDAYLGLESRTGGAIPRTVGSILSINIKFQAPDFKNPIVGFNIATSENY